MQAYPKYKLLTVITSRSNLVDIVGVFVKKNAHSFKNMVKGVFSNKLFD